MRGRVSWTTRPFSSGKGEAEWRKSGYNSSGPDAWLPQIVRQLSGHAGGSELDRRIDALAAEVRLFMPWLLPDYESLRKGGSGDFQVTRKASRAGNCNRLVPGTQRRLNAASRDPGLLLMPSSSS